MHVIHKASVQSLLNKQTLEEEQYQMTLEALADVDAGRVVEHEVMLAWMESLSTKNPLENSDK